MAMVRQGRDSHGERVVEHVVRAGETFSGIAMSHDLPNYQGLIIYNTKCVPILSSANPSHLQVGTRLLIPRTPNGYRNWLKATAKLKHEVIGEYDKIYYGLDALKFQHTADDIEWDLWGGILTSVASLGTKAILAGRGVLLAHTARAEAASATYWQNFNSFAQYEKSGVSLLAGFDEAALAASKKFRVEGGKKLFDKAAGKQIALLRKIGSVVVSRPQTFRGMSEAVVDTFVAGVEYLGYLNPSVFARIAVTGNLALPSEYVDEATQQQKQIENQAKKIDLQLDEKMRRIAEEAKTVWGVVL